MPLRPCFFLANSRCVFIYFFLNRGWTLSSLSVRRSWKMCLIPLILTATNTSPWKSSPPALVRFSVCFFPLKTMLLSSVCVVWCFDCAPVFFLVEFLSGQEISVEEEGMGEKNPCKSPTEVLYQTEWEENLPRREDEDEEEKHFCMLMENLGANSVFEEWVLYCVFLFCSHVISLFTLLTAA